MPNMTGDQVVEAIRANPEYNNTRIIMVTTEAGKDKIGAVMRNGANGFVIKPFQIAQMKKVLKQVVGRL
jgi:two-component system chemotaxis response regulator CheY